MISRRSVGTSHGRSCGRSSAGQLEMCCSSWQPLLLLTHCSGLSLRSSCCLWQGSEAREAVALTAFQPQDLASRHHQPLPHHSPAQNKRQRLAPSHSMHRQQHPPLPAIPVNHRHQPLPAIPEMTSRGMHTSSRSRAPPHHASSGLLLYVLFSIQPDQHIQMHTWGKEGGESWG